MPTTNKTKKRRHRLVALELDEVSLVDRGANRKKILLTKRDAEMPSSVAQKVKSLDARKLAKCVASVRSLVNKAEEGELAPLSEDAAAALEAIARILTPVANEVTDAHLDALQASLGIASDPDDDDVETPPPPLPPEPPVAKADDKKDDEDEQDEDSEPDKSDDDPEPEEEGDGLDEDVEKEAPKLTADKPEDMTQEEFDAALKAAEEAFAAAIAKVDYKDPVHKSAKDNAMKDALSVFTPAQRAALMNIRKADEAEKRQLILKVEAQQKELAERRDRDVVRKCEDDARSVAHLPTDKVVSVLKSLRSAGQDEAAEQVLALMRQQSALVTKAAEFGGDLFDVAGSQADADSPEGQIEALVKDAVAKSAGNQTYEQAYAKVIKSKDGRKLLRKIDGRG